MILKNKRIVITGGAGFIGSHLVDSLCKDNEVKVVDNLVSPMKNTIRQHIDSNNINFFNLSVMNLKGLQEVFANTDYIFHLAANPNLQESIKDPLSTHDVNSTGTLNVLIAAKDNNVRKVIFASTSAVYSDSDISLSEDYKIDPSSPYAVSKVIGEQYCQLFSKLYDLNTVCLRFFNVYGERQDPDGPYSAAIPKFILRILKNQPIEIYGDGKQTRDFIHVSDVALALNLSAKSICSDGDIINVGSGNAYSINFISDIIIKKLGEQVAPSYLPSLPGDVMSSIADISKAKEELGFENSIDIHEGLEKTINFYKKAYPKEFSNI